MTEEQFEQIEDYEWDKFCRRYPNITDLGFWSRLILLFRHKGNVPRLLWENGFRHGWIIALQHYKKEAGQ